MEQPRKIAIVLGGGGMRGVAHVGVLKVLARHGIVPDFYVGTSVGSLIASMAAGGMMPEEIERAAMSIRRQDILDYDWWGLLLRRGHNRSLYKGKALHDWVRRTLPVDRFDQLLKPAYITSVDVQSGREVVWGMPGLTDVPIHDTIVASCSIPGIYPPKQINRYWFVDGSMVDPLPVKVAVYHQATLIIAVYLDRTDVGHRTPAPASSGFMGIVERGHTLLSRTICRHDLQYFSDAPLALIEPEVENHGVFQFDHTEECIAAGELAAEEALARHPLLRDFSRPAETKGMEVPPALQVPRPDTHAHHHHPSPSQRDA